jgi:hypothetical protein
MSTRLQVWPVIPTWPNEASIIINPVRLQSEPSKVVAMNTLRAREGECLQPQRNLAKESKNRPERRNYIKGPRRRLCSLVAALDNAYARLQSQKTIEMLKNLYMSLKKPVCRQENCSLGDLLLKSA